MKIKMVKIFGIFVVFFSTFLNSVFALSPQSELIYRGIDVSDWQRYIDYSQVKNSGVDIVYIKASQGTTIKDPYFEINYESAKANGLKVGFYHFLDATTVEEAEKEASFFVSVISGKQPDCKLALDYERFNGISKEEINQIAITFIRKVEELTKKQVIIYSDLSNSENTFNSETAGNAELWIAYYENYRNLERINTSWQNFVGIQNSDRGRVSGINGYVDTDLYTKEILLDDTEQIPPIDNSNQNYNTELILYTVKSGDTLWKIASTYGTTIQEIANINGIQNVNLIFPGQILRIPTNSNIPGSESNSTSKTYYTVRRGDTLSKIALSYGITVNQIVEWNNIQNPNLIYPGERLKFYGHYTSSKNYFTYVVKRGDSLWRIARRFRVSVRYLVNLNALQNPNLIYPGQILKI